MGLQAVYERFLVSPNPVALADDAILQYVTTLKTFSQQRSIVTHLDDQNNNVVKKKSERVISAVEGLTAVAVIVETTLEFLSNGGAYLPGLDSFILGRTATLPITHFVHFDPNDKIAQIHLSWDQADLLKQVEVIGARGKNWPVFAGKDQIKIITASTTTANQVNPAPALSPRGRSRANGKERSASPTKKFIKDPHASLNLYHQEEEERRPSAPNAVAPRESHKPLPREMSELFAAGHEDYEGVGPDGSPKKQVKENFVAPKGAGHKKFQPSRIFDDENPAPVKEPHIYKTNPARYNHFDIGDADENDHFQHRPDIKSPQDVPIRPKGGSKPAQHASQWAFEDFMTPAKIKQKIRGQDVVHFSYGETEQPQQDTGPLHPGKARKDAENHFEFQADQTPIHRQAIPKARKDAQTHFNFTDESTPAPRRIIARTKDAAKLYADPVFGEASEGPPLASRSNNARKDLASQWDADDNPPANDRAAKPGQHRKGLETHWDF